MAKRLKCLGVIFLSVIVCGVALACQPKEDTSWSEYATFYDHVEKYACEEYLQENITKYPFDGSDLPFDRVNIIRSQSEFENAIQDGHIEIDFDTEVLVLYLFTDIYMGFGCRLQSVKIDGDVLKINILHEMAPKSWDGSRPSSTSEPTQRCMAVKTTLTDFGTANVKLSYED